MLRVSAFLALAMVPASALAQPAPFQQPPWLADPPTRIESAISRFSSCVAREIRTLPASLAADVGAARVVAACDPQLAAVEREAVRIIARSRLSEDRKALALRDLRNRLAQAAERVGTRIERRRARTS
jgi:hypothetical protein